MSAALYRKEAEAWLAIVEALEHAPEALGRVRPRDDVTFVGDNLAPIGLCSVVLHMRVRGLVSAFTENRMLRRIAAELERGGGGPYLHQPYIWTDGVRLQWARYFMREAGGTWVP